MAECVPKLAILIYIPSYWPFLQGCTDTLPVGSLCSLLLDLGRPGTVVRVMCVTYKARLETVMQLLLSFLSQDACPSAQWPCCEEA